MTGELTIYDPAAALVNDEAQLYRSFSQDGNPTLKTTLAAMKSLGLWLTTKTPTLP